MSDWQEYEKKKEEWRKIALQISEGLAAYIYPEDCEDENWQVELGNLPMGCPNCGRCRLNFHPDRRLIDCEKCDWTSSAIMDWETKHLSHAVVSLTKEQFDNVTEILKDKITSCEDFNCSGEARRTRELLEHFLKNGQKDNQ